MKDEKENSETNFVVLEDTIENMGIFTVFFKNHIKRYLLIYVKKRLADDWFYQLRF